MESSFDDGAETEVDAHVAVRIIAGAAADFVDEEAGAGFHGDASADGVAAGAIFLRFGGEGSADEPEGDPVIGGRKVVDEKAGRSVHVADDGGELAIVPEIADGEAARRTRSGDSGTGVRGDVGEGGVAVVVIKDARFLEIAAEMLAIDFGIDVAIDEEKIGPAVVIEIEEHGAPPEVFGVEAETGGDR